MLHIIFAVAGLSALLAASSTAFVMIKYLGAAYLIYLGLCLFFQQTDKQTASINSIDSLITIFKQGVLINLLNPKVALFFLAFIPQFIDPASTQKPLAFLVLGLILNFNGTMVIFAIAWLTVKMKHTLKNIGNNGAAFKKVLGLGFMGLGAKLALER